MQRQIGIVAQEAEAFFPEIATGASGVYKASPYDQLVLVLIGALR